ncbi:MULTISPECIES: collagenase [unclassified Pseudoalteromonas]|uniref:collagenase n=1 Tax=unclassified Pseudoalteromonas TaxID=194690 RepID=UPI003014FB11
MKYKVLTLAMMASAMGAAHGAEKSIYKPLSQPLQAVQQLSHGHEHRAERDDEQAPLATRTDPGHLITPFHLTQQLANTAAQSSSCDLGSLANASSNQLVELVKAQGSGCINDLFSASAAIQVGVFNSSNMEAVATAAKTLSQNYTGSGNNHLETLFLFLRAGFYVEFYNDQVAFTAEIKTAVKAAVDAFVANQHFYANNNAHGKVLAEVITTMDSAELQHAYLGVVKSWLSKWNDSYAQHWHMRSAVNGIFTILYRGQWNPNFVELVRKDQQLVTLLGTFTAQTWMVNSDSEYLIINAASELARLKLYTGASIQAAVDQELKDLFSRYQSYGFGDGIWLAAADVASYHSDCSQFNICDFDKTLEAKVLAQQYSCSDTIKIRAQELSDIQLDSACQAMGDEELRFHTMLETGRVPVSDDYNDFLQVNIFNSSAAYKKYAKAIFKINTDNGGMYLEGTPSDSNNIANFVAYEADYAKAEHYIWNLEHEYVHYLDGRFDLYGDFNAPTQPIVWWSEGVAEYIAKLNDNQAALDTISDGSVYSLQQIFATTYEGFDQDRIYRWGYLAVRFMYERHVGELKAMRQETRSGNWQAYQQRVNRWANDYQEEFEQWTQALVASDENQSPSAQINGPYQGQAGAAIQFSSQGSIDPDGDELSYLWQFGDGTQSQVANPSHSYDQSGEYQVHLTVSDPNGLTHSDSTTVVVQASDNQQLQSGVPVSVSGQQDQQVVYQVAVPAEATNLLITTTSGTGDADLYVKAGAAPSLSDFDCRPYQGGNEEVCEIVEPTATEYYIMLHGYNDFSNVSLTARYTVASNVEDICQSQGSVSSGRLRDGETVCLGNQAPMWFSLENVSAQQSVMIETAHGSGDLALQYSNQGWPNESNVDASSFNLGNKECIMLGQQANYWGYLKVSGNSNGAALKVVYNEQSCQ